MLELRQPPNDRTILWYYDEAGGCGKTAMAKHILHTFQDCLFLSGGNFKDASYQIIKQKQDPKVILVNLPRTSEGRVSYASFEAIKDGLIQSGKYEGGYRIYAPPHLVVMANFVPELSALSLDRWDIRYLGNNRRLQ